jgi:RNA polymerase sigma-70 factor (ECF subfamily)
VAHNLVVDESRRLVHRNHLSLEEQLLADGASVDEQARQSILTTEARQALRSLTPKQRSVIVLKYLDGMDNAEVARILRLPIGAVKSLQNRALAALRRELSRASAWIAEGETV